jgi:protein TonB
MGCPTAKADGPKPNELMTGVAPNPNLARSQAIRPPVSRSVKVDNLRTAEGVSIPSVIALVLWLGCLTVGGLGLALPYARPHPPAKQPEAIQAQMLNVELTRDPLPPDIAPSPSNPSQPPPLSEQVVAPQPPPLLAVAEPNPAIAFALPVAGPARVVEAPQAGYAQTTAGTTTASPPAQTLTFGQGEGKQPAPEYPLRARREGQEGVVGVRFSVNEDGRVLAVETAAASPWALLNEAALRTVRERWRFRAGPPRCYQVSIRFELTK